jgi:thioredoxin reductase
VALNRARLVLEETTATAETISGIEGFFGKSVFACPSCDAWELRDQAVGGIGAG